ncbi:MAG: insulinase family protein [Acidimicrobiia bacterium]|nr:insulinase family protein [Acidimicrobiia bacterium]
MIDGGAPAPDATPLPVDPDTERGTLDNGLTWYARSNGLPGQSVTMRLVVRAGGLQDSPRGAGTAHFLEHMMFNGTEQFPGNELDATLRSIGAEIGPDLNAYTTDSETVYQVTVPDEGDNVDVAFDVLAQWASAATLDPAEVAAEVGVIREEERSSAETGEGKVNAAFDQAYFLGTPWQGVDVLGTPDAIAATTPEALRAYYDTWYRPDNMAVIAVGDRPAAELEAAIAERFGALMARGGAPSPDPGPVPVRQSPYADVVVAPGYAESFVSIDYPLPNWNLGTRDGNHLAWLDDVAGAIIGERLNDGLSTGRLPLTTAFAGPFWHTRSLHYMGFNVDAPDLVTGTETLVTEIRRAVAGGFTADELSRARRSFLSGEDQRLAEAGSRQDGDLADAMVEHYLDGADLQPVTDSVAMTRSVLGRMTLEELNAYWRWAMTAQAPILMAVGPDAARVGRVEDHEAALDRALKADVVAIDDTPVTPIEALMVAPEPVNETERADLAHNPGVQLRFANGVRLLFSPADFAAAQVSLSAWSPGGLARLAPDDRAVAFTAVEAVAASGFGPYGPVQVRRYLLDTDVYLSPWVDLGAEGYTGGSSVDDLEILFQLLHLYITAPRADAVPLNQAVTATRDDVAQVTLDPSYAADSALSAARYSRLGLPEAGPTPAQLDALTPERALGLYQSRFAAPDGLVVAITGDVDEGTVIDLARRYLGTLPAAQVAEPAWSADPAPAVERRIEAGTGGLSGAYRLSLTAGAVPESAVNQVLADLTVSVLDDRLFTVVREQLGATYGGSSGVTFDEGGDAADLTVSLDGDPARLDEIVAAVGTELNALAAGQVAVADFGEARAVLQNRYNYVDHDQILEALLDEGRDPATVVDPDQALDVLAHVTPAHLAGFVARFTGSPSRIDVRAVPAH